jgi:hypothetical protein
MIEKDSKTDRGHTNEKKENLTGCVKKNDKAKGVEGEHQKEAPRKSNGYSASYQVTSRDGLQIENGTTKAGRTEPFLQDKISIKNSET